MMIRYLAAAGLCWTAPAHAGGDYAVRTDCGARANCFPSLTKALEAAERDAAGPVAIRIGPGIFREKPTIRRDGIRIIGSGTARTRIVFDAVAERAAGYDRGGWGTAGSATLTVAADDVRISGLTIENAFDYPANDALPAGSPGRVSASQGVAVALDTGSDRVVFDRVAILGYQDTLFTRGKRAVVRNSLVAGNVDFVFGDGALLIEDSELRTRRRGAVVPPGDYASYVAAPSTPVSQPIGIVVVRTRLTREAGVADGTVALGRPWHPTTTFPDGRYADPDAVGQAMFVDCWMDAHIHPDGWTTMNGTARDGTKTAVFHPQDARFAEVRSRGPGARRTPIGLRWRDVPDRAALRATFAFADTRR